jgi:hypothetical protein
MNALRQFLLAGLCGCLWCDVARGATPPEESDSRFRRTMELVERVTAKKLPAAKAIEQLRELQSLPPKKKAEDEDEDDHVPFLSAELFQAACVRPSPKDFADLTEILAKFPVGESQNAECFSAYTAAAFRLAVEKLRREPQTLKLPPAAVKWPDELKPECKTSREALQAWVTAMTSSGPRLTTGLLQVDVEELPAKSEASLRKLLLSPAAGVWKEFAERNESETATERYLRARGVLLALIGEGKLEEAVGVACAQLGNGDAQAWAGDRPYSAVLADFLTALGLDWELIYAGSIIPMVLSDPGELPRALGGGQYEGWNALGAFGSARGVHLGLDTIRELKIAPRLGFDFLTRAADPGSDGTPPIMEQPEVVSREKALPAKVRAEVLAALASYLDGSSPLERLDESLTLLHAQLRWLIKELRTPLTKLFKHPNHRIASKALELLVDAKVASPKTRITPAPAPLRLRVLLDGQPLVRTTMKVSGPDLDELELTTDQEGHLRVPLDTALKPAELNEVTLHVGPPKEDESSESPDEEEAAKKPAKPDAKPKPWPGPWIDYAAQIKDHDHESEIDIVTGELEVGLEAGPGVSKETEVEVELAKESDADRDDVEPWIKAKGKPGGTVVFSKLQVGSYKVFVTGDGLADVEPAQVRVVKSGTIKLMKLQAAPPPKPEEPEEAAKKEK